MALWDSIFGEFIDVIDWLDDSDNTMVYRFERHNNEIKYGAKLTVRETQAAVFVNEGEIADVLEAGLYELETKNIPILSSLQHWDHLFNSPFKAEVYFCNLKRFTDLKWGTKNPIMLRDEEFGAVRLRAFGIYEIKIKDPKKFIQEIVGTDGHFTVEEISDQLRNIIISRFTSIVASSKIPVLDLAANYEQLSGYITKKIADEFDDYGIELTKVIIENISLPPAVEDALDKRTSMGMIGDLSKYLEFQAAESMTSNKGGSSSSVASDAVSMGIGLAMADKLSNSMNKKESDTSSITPPKINSQKTYYYAKEKEPIGPFSIDEFELLVKDKKVTPETLMWKVNMKDWQKAKEFDEMQKLFNLSSPPPL